MPSVKLKNAYVVHAVFHMDGTAVAPLRDLQLISTWQSFWEILQEEFCLTLKLASRYMKKIFNISNH